MDALSQGHCEANNQDPWRRPGKSITNIALVFSSFSSSFDAPSHTPADMRRRRYPAFPSTEETLKHPAYPATIWALEPHQKGKLPVAKDRGGPVNIAWEVHGDGPIKLVVRCPRCNFPRPAYFSLLPLPSNMRQFGLKLTVTSSSWVWLAP